jgi:DNA repair protein RadC
MAAQKLGEATLKEQPLLNNWSKLTEYLNLTMGRQRNELAKALFLDTKNQLIADEILNEGDVKFVQMSCRKILARALELNSTAIILAHNHPSGDPKPSQCDIDFTQDFRIAASYMDVVLHDHVVVGNGRYFSFRREGLLL